MKLSDAIRLGAMLLPQCHPYLEEDPVGSPPTACCALGGAALAMGFQRRRDLSVDKFLTTQWTWLFLQSAMDPRDGGYVVSSVGNMISLLNWRGWTRERIADWVASIEPQEDPLPAAPLGEPCHHEFARSCT